MLEGDDCSEGMKGVRFEIGAASMGELLEKAKIIRSV